jgi:hypothetical protein
MLIDAMKGGGGGASHHHKSDYQSTCPLQLAFVLSAHFAFLHPCVLLRLLLRWSPPPLAGRMEAAQQRVSTVTLCVRMVAVCSLRYTFRLTHALMCGYLES